MHRVSLRLVINKYQQEMKKEAEVQTFSNDFLFVLLKVLIVSNIGQNLMINFSLIKMFFFLLQFSKIGNQKENFLVNGNISYVLHPSTSKTKNICFTHLHTWFTHTHTTFAQKITAFNYFKLQFWFKKLNMCILCM